MVIKIRKIHRFLSMPMLILVIANIATKNMELNHFIEPITAVNMVLMTITGSFLYFLTRKKTKN